MFYQYNEKNSNGTLQFTLNEKAKQRFFFKERDNKLLTIAWNRGKKQTVIIDEIEYAFPANHFLCLMVNQSFRFERAEDVWSWEFNRDFYCIVDHDKEVSCVGFLFYGMRDISFIALDEKETRSFDLLSQVFVEEFQNNDTIQGEMLRMLLKRLIIKLTRLAKTQTLNEPIKEQEFDLVRQFSLMVENNYKKCHQVQEYAALMHKSPKTLSNLFSQYHTKTPLQIIQDRIALEARRLLIYTDKTNSEIAYELGFEELSTFSRFFKKVVGTAPQDFKRELHKV